MFSDLQKSMFWLKTWTHENMIQYDLFSTNIFFYIYTNACWLLKLRASKLVTLRNMNLLASHTSPKKVACFSWPSILQLLNSFLILADHFFCSWILLTARIQIYKQSETEVGQWQLHMCIHLTSFYITNNSVTAIVGPCRINVL